MDGCLEARASKKVTDTETTSTGGGGFKNQTLTDSTEQRHFTDERYVHHVSYAIAQRLYVCVCVCV